MPWLFHIFLAVHVGAGIVGLLSFWGAIAAAKGNAAHRRWGRLFALSIYVASAQALGMGVLSVIWPLAMHPQLTNAELYRGLFGWMMIYLGLLAIGMTHYGLQMVANKRAHGRNRRWSMLGLQIAVLIAGANCLVQGIRLSQPLMIIVSLIGFATTLTFFRYIYASSPAPRDYVSEHLKAMVATGIAAYTAFLSVGLIELLPHLAFNPVIWAVPSVVGMGLIVHFLRRYPKAIAAPEALTKGQEA